METEIDGRTVVFALMDGYFYNDPAAVLLVAVAGYTVDAVYQRLYRLLRLPALETKLDALTARILQNIVGSKEV